MVNTSNLRTKMVVVGWLLLMAVGIAYAVQIQRDDVGGIVAIGRVQTPQETILLYSQITSATADMTVLNFGTGDVDAFGFFVTPREVSFWAANAGGVAFSITVEASGVVLHRPGTGDTALAAGVLSLLMGPANGKLLPSPDHATLIPTGSQPVALEAGLIFRKTPGELGLASGDRINLYRTVQGHHATSADSYPNAHAQTQGCWVVRWNHELCMEPRPGVPGCPLRK